MKFKNNTLALIVIALSLTGFVYFYEIKGKPEREAAKAKQEQIFDFKTEQVKSFTLTVKEKVLTIERNNDIKNQKSKWQIKVPVQKAASQASVDFLLDRLTTGKSDRTFSIPAATISEFGLDQPQAKVEINLDNKQSHHLILGKPEFSNRFLYAQVDPPSPPPQNLSVILVPIDFKTAVDRPLPEWQEQDKQETPTATPTATPTPKDN
ncbi:DUF4340 domain-containing protein [Kamptonema sp. UHCC 0994]|uniref:DUF4340 domain-containing protein n=1 Tax=Kamptonema sp. UHCC 0994 TaxID=3031329 RepID=UPI0023B9CCCC|nr:DUF4340 domain-containing protein [Kamptonema sp. UHCC 0994]MDF0552956.1 DUF4340 domain-containing protein [Kamptonema sp. UHCC 0994]